MGARLRDIFDLWDEFLMQLTFHQSRFLSIFVDETCIALVRPTQIDPKVDDYLESIEMWLLHILIHPSWENSREAGCVVIESVLQVCFSNPNYWTSRLALALVEDQRYLGLRQVYQEQIETMKKHIELSYLEQYLPRESIVKATSIS